MSSRRPSRIANRATGPGGPTFTDEVEALERRLLAMRRLVSEQVTHAVRLLNPVTPRAGRPMLREAAVDALGARIESECLSILARGAYGSRQERRLLGTIIRIATALERIGDAGTLMVERSAELAGETQLLGASNVVELMAANALEMVAQAVTAFSTRNIELATMVRTSRPVVGGFGEQLVQESLRAVRDADGPPIGSAMRFVAIADHLEQIAGHAVSIAERVVNLIEDPPREPDRLAQRRTLRARRRDVPALRLRPR